MLIFTLPSFFLFSLLGFFSTITSAIHINPLRASRRAIWVYCRVSEVPAGCVGCDLEGIDDARRWRRQSVDCEYGAVCGWYVQCGWGEGCCSGGFEWGAMAVCLFTFDFFLILSGFDIRSGVTNAKQNTMAGTYPDIFTAASIYSAGSSGNTRSMYPGYTGSYPKI
jgi:hypothetical protein